MLPVSLITLAATLIVSIAQIITALQQRAR
jgi:hypothetical protein